MFALEMTQTPDLIHLEKSAVWHVSQAVAKDVGNGRSEDAGV